ncbi:hypothetical protein [Reyranella sp.]|uniref:hypothetical protein n=1 Tax=Reyranella sp. TaxID=1929291 RepID=UPI003D0BFC11
MTNFVFKTHKKNSYVRLEEGSYPREYLNQIENARSCLANGNLGNTKNVRINPRSGHYEVTMGYGRRNWWFENDLIGRGAVARCRTKGEAMEVLDQIYAEAESGKFDEALEALRIQRQEHADLMIKKRNVCGFHDSSLASHGAPE